MLQFLEEMLEAERQENLEKALSLEPTKVVKENNLELGSTETIKIQSNTPQAPEPEPITIKPSNVSSIFNG